MLRDYGRDYRARSIPDRGQVTSSVHVWLLIPGSCNVCDELIKLKSNDITFNGIMVDVFSSKADEFREKVQLGRLLCILRREISFERVMALVTLI